MSQSPRKCTGTATSSRSSSAHAIWWICFQSCVVRRLAGQCVGSQRVLHDVVGAIGHHPDRAEHSRQRPRAVRAASGPEQEDPVPRLPVLGEEEVRVDDGFPGGRGDAPRQRRAAGLSSRGELSTASPASYQVSWRSSSAASSRNSVSALVASRGPGRLVVLSKHKTRFFIANSLTARPNDPETLTVRVCQAKPGCLAYCTTRNNLLANSSVSGPGQCGFGCRYPAVLLIGLRTVDIRPVAPWKGIRTGLAAEGPLRGYSCCCSHSRSFG